MSLVLKLSSSLPGRTVDFMFSQLGQCAAQARRAVMHGDIVSEGEVIATVNALGVIRDLDRQVVHL